MATSVRDRKLARRFELMDANGDGFLEQEDFEAMARRLVQGFAEPPTSPRARAVVDLADTTQNGTLDVAECSRLMRLFGVREAEAVEGFGILTKR